MEGKLQSLCNVWDKDLKREKIKHFLSKAEIIIEKEKEASA